MYSKEKYNKLKTMHDRLFEEKQELIDENQDLKCQTKQLEADNEKLEKEMSHINEEKRELKITLQDIKKVCNQQDVEIQRLKDEVELNKKTCKDCVNLRQEIDQYWFLLNQWKHGTAADSSAPPSPPSPQGLPAPQYYEAVKKKANRAEGNISDTKSRAEASKCEMQTTRTMKTTRTRQETFQESSSKTKKI